MPKNKKDETSSESDSDSGPDDRNSPPAVKKAKQETTTTTTTAAAAKTGSKNASSYENENRWVLEKLRFASVKEFRGRKMVDIREFYERNGDILPGKKGISLSVTQWKKLMEIAEEINDALQD